MAKKDADLEPEAIDEKNSKSSRLQNGLRKTLRWVIVALLVFVLGFLLIWVVFVGPRAAEITAWQTKATESQLQILGLQTQVADLQGIEAHLIIANMVRDLEKARYELVRENTPADAQASVLTAKAALNSLSNGLTSLGDRLGAESDAALKSIRERLELVMRDLTMNDKFAALNDLEVLENSIQNLECDLFCTNSAP